MSIVTRQHRQAAEKNHYPNNLPSWRPSLPFAVCIFEWGVGIKTIHVHLGGPLRHPNTFLGGPFRWHRADYRQVWPPGPKWPQVYLKVLGNSR